MGLSALAFTSLCYGSAIVAGFNGTVDGRNDDGTYTTGGCNNDTDGGTCSGTLVPIGFNINLYSINSNSLYVNTNGNVTFDYPLSAFSPFGLANVPVQIIAPYFADLDTRNPQSGVVSFGPGMFQSRNAFGVNWFDVGYYQQQVDKTNSFQLLLVDRTDTGAGNFDIIFNYNRVLFETGDGSHGMDGLGGDSAYVGFSDGTGNPGTYVELPGSGVPGSLIDSGTNALVLNSLNSSVLGRYIFSARGGEIQTPAPTPEPGTLALLATAALLAAPFLRRRIFAPSRPLQ